MLFKLSNSSTILPLTLSHSKQSETCLKKTIFTLLLRKNAFYSKASSNNYLKFVKYHENWTVKDWKRIL